MRQRIVLLVLIVHGGLLAWQAYRYSPTLDEPAHLVAGISHWKLGRFELYRVNPPLVRIVAALPMIVVDPEVDWSAYTEATYSRPEFAIGRTFTDSNGFNTFLYFTLCRWTCIPFSLIGGYICYRWACDLYGLPSGLTALTLWCFCPNILGNGALITPDVPAAALGVAAAYFFWRWLRKPIWPRALICSLVLGLAELTKATWISLFPLFPAIWLIWRITQRPLGKVAVPIESSGPSLGLDDLQFSPHSFSSVAQLASILAFALYLLNLGYAFENSFQPLDKYRFISQSLGGLSAHESPGNLFEASLLGKLPVPLPANYLVGVDVQKYDFERKKWSYLRGEQKFGGWWYYYLYAMLVKMPVGTLFLFAATCVISFARLGTACMRIYGSSSRWNATVTIPCANRDALALLAPAFVLLVLVSSQTGFSRYLRYVLPCFPFAFIWSSQLAAFGQRACSSYRMRNSHRLLALKAIVILSVLATVISSLSVFPHNLSYFNEPSGGPLNGHRHLLDANLDWGQDLLWLKRWSDAHPEVHGLCFRHFGFVKPETAGIASDIAARQRTTYRSADPLALPFGWHAISANELYAYKHFGDGPDEVVQLRQLQPVARAGYSIYIFHIQDER